MTIYKNMKNADLLTKKQLYMVRYLFVTKTNLHCSFFLISHENNNLQKQNVISSLKLKDMPNIDLSNGTI